MHSDRVSLEVRFDWQGTFIQISMISSWQTLGELTCLSNWIIKFIVIRLWLFYMVFRVWKLWSKHLGRWKLWSKHLGSEYPSTENHLVFLLMFIHTCTNGTAWFCSSSIDDLSLCPPKFNFVIGINCLLLSFNIDILSSTPWNLKINDTSNLPK